MLKSDEVIVEQEKRKIQTNRELPRFFDLGYNERKRTIFFFFVSFYRRTSSHTHACLIFNVNFNFLTAQ